MIGDRAQVEHVPVPMIFGIVLAITAYVAISMYTSMPDPTTLEQAANHTATPNFDFWPYVAMGGGSFLAIIGAAYAYTNAGFKRSPP